MRSDSPPARVMRGIAVMPVEREAGDGTHQAAARGAAERLVERARSRPHAPLVLARHVGPVGLEDRHARRVREGVGGTEVPVAHVDGGDERKGGAIGGGHGGAGWDDRRPAPADGGPTVTMHPRSLLLCGLLALVVVPFWARASRAADDPAPAAPRSPRRPPTR